MSDQPTYLYASIGDIQGTIRAIDTKLGVALTFLILPISQLPGILTVGTQLTKGGSVWETAVGIGVCILFAGLWFLALFSAFMGLRGIGDPREHMAADAELSGTFYSGDLFRPKLMHAFVPWPKLMAARTVAEHVSRQPETTAGMTRELVFEQMKLAYIRDVKMCRQNLAFILLGLWLVVGTVLWAVAVWPGNGAQG